MNIRAKIIAGFGASLLLVLAITVIGISRIKRINMNLTEINDVNTVKQRDAINFRGSVHDRSIRIRDFVLLTDARERADALSDIRALEDFYAQRGGAARRNQEKQGGNDAAHRTDYCIRK